MERESVASAERETRLDPQRGRRVDAGWTDGRHQRGAAPQTACPGSVSGHSHYTLPLNESLNYHPEKQSG